jgi:hypothetical protein
MIHHKIAVDGGSKDNTLSILKSHGWDTWTTTPGIPGQANLALSHVDTDFFACFEHDVVLNKSWTRILENFNGDEKLMGVSGKRNYDGSKTMLAIDTYAMKRGNAGSAWKYPIDNTIFKTEIVRRLGGFPTYCPFSADTLLRIKALNNNYRWIADERFVSKHLRDSFLATARHNVRHLIMSRLVWQKESRLKMPPSFRVFRLMMTPITGARIAAQEKAPWAFPGYVVLRYPMEFVIFFYRKKATQMAPEVYS